MTPVKEKARLFALTVKTGTSRENRKRFVIRTENPCAPGSNPGLGTNNIKGLQSFDCEPFLFGATSVLPLK